MGILFWFGTNFQSRWPDHSCVSFFTNLFFKKYKLALSTKLVLCNYLRIITPIRYRQIFSGGIGPKNWSDDFTNLVGQKRGRKKHTLLTLPSIAYDYAALYLWDLHEWKSTQYTRFVYTLQIIINISIWKSGIQSVFHIKYVLWDLKPIYFYHQIHIELFKKL